MIETEPSIDLAERFTGLLLGTAVGDALGLPAENLSADKIRKRWNGQWKMRFIFGRGMISDDTEHTLMVAQALLSHPNDAKAFQLALAWKFRWWFAGLPGGVGLATAKACLKLWIGFPASKSAVQSAGSGPAMRSAILGAYFADEPEKRREFVLTSSRLTHRGWQAETAALAVAESVALSVMNDGNVGPTIILPALVDLSHEEEWAKLIKTIELSLKADKSVSEFACSLGLKKAVTGYSMHVVPVALYAWLRHRGDFRTALISVLECGGDTDTTGAILGAFAGCSGGRKAIPIEWVNSIWDWPRSNSVLERVAACLAEQKKVGKPVSQVYYFWPGLIPRNLLFFATILTHGFRRLFPPY